MTLGIAPPDRAGEIARDGRRVGFAEWGPPRGAPVLYCPGAAMTSSFAFGSDALGELGVRLVCVDRAGLGRSSPDPDKSFATWAADAGAVLRELALERPAIVGFSQGAPFALALAPLASSITIVSGTDELAHPSVRPRLHPDVARMIDAIEADASAFEAGFAPRVDAEGMFALVVGTSSPHDRRVYEEPAFAAAYRASLADAFAQGPGGYVRDVVLAMSRWPMRLEDIAVPVHLFYGALDASPVHSPDFGVTMQARLPNATRRTFEDEGGSLLWTRSREILSAVLRDDRCRTKESQGDGEAGRGGEGR